MEYLSYLLQSILHLDKYLISFVAAHGLWTYVVVFFIIFAETGLVITPFLPGDSLLFALGSLAANTQNPLNIVVLLPLLIIASWLGNQLNYFIGRFIGPYLFSKTHSRWINKKHLAEAHQFYETHGGKTILFARFIPIIRTFVPFVAGISYMSIALFNFYNIISAILWIGSLLSLGYFLGSLPFIKDHFSIVIYGIMIISMLPPIFSVLSKKAKS